MTSVPRRIRAVRTTATLVGLGAVLAFGPRSAPAVSETNESSAAGPASRPHLAEGDGPIARRHVVEFQANVFTTSTQSRAALDMGPDGRLVVAWDSRRQQGGTYGVYARCFDALGRPLTHEVRLNETVRGMQHRPAVAVSETGEIWAVWQSYAQDGHGESVVARRFSADLEPLTDEIAVNVSRQGDQGDAVVAVDDAGRALVAWSSSEDGGRTAGIDARLLDTDGTPLSGEVRLSGIHGGADGLPAVSALPEGRFAVVWARRDAEGDPHRIVGRIVNDAGGAGSNEFVVAAAGLGTGEQHVEPAIAADASGRFVVAWMSSAEDGYAVRIRRFDAGARPVGEARTLETPEEGWTSGVAVAASPEGRFAVAWNGDGPDGDGEGIFARVVEFDTENATETDGTVYRVNEHVPGSQALTIGTGARRLVWAGPDVLAAAWNGDAGAGDDSAAAVTLLVPADRVARLAARPAPDLGPSRPADPVGAAETRIAIPPIWNPDWVPQEPMPPGIANFGDFGFEAVPGAPWTPPDPELAVGPTDIVVVTNGQIATFRKDGTVRWRDEIENTFGFWGELGTDNFVFDPEVTWDPHADRFWAMANERSDDGRSNFLLAVSKDDSPDDRDDWYKWRLDVTDLADNDIDSPNLALNENYVLLTADFFGPDKYLIYIIDKSSIIDGGVPVTTSELITGQSQQSMGIPVVYTAGDDHLYILQSTEFSVNDTVIIHAITDPFGRYARETFTLDVPSYTYPNQPPQRGTTSRPFLFEPRFWSVAERDNALWAVHHVNSSRVRVRWYEIELNGWPTGGTPNLAQSGEIDLGDGIHTFFPSIHVDAEDNAAITFSRSASNEYISIGRAMRRATDPPGFMGPSQVVRTSFNAHTSGRWGDYSGTQADPVQPDTFWGHHEWTNGSTSSWRTWVARFDLRPAPFLLDLDLPLVAGQDTLLRATGATPGQRVYFVYSFMGTALTESPILGVTGGLMNPVLGRSAVTDGAGVAEVGVRVPGDLGGFPIWIQAAETGETTDVVATTIQ